MNDRISVIRSHVKNGIEQQEKEDTRMSIDY